VQTKHISEPIKLYIKFKYTSWTISEEHFHYEDYYVRGHNSGYSGEMSAAFLLGLFFDPEDGSNVSPKIGSTFSEVHGGIPRKKKKSFTHIS
jgi:hypothetical protein